MSMKHLLYAAAAGAALALTALPAAAYPGTPSASTVSYTTQLTPVYGPSAPYSGTLNLTVSPSGIVRGYYFTADQSRAFVPVTGGESNGKIWFDIGNAGAIHVDARMQNGKIVGSAIENGTPYAFVAQPA